MRNPYVKQTELKKEDLVVQHAPMVKHVANRLSARLPAGIDRDDLVQAGMIGLLEAAEKFDPKAGVKFKTFAEFRVRGAMLDDLRARDWIPRSVREAAHKLENAYTTLRASGVDHPNDKELAVALELKPKELGEFLGKARPIPVLSLEGMGSGHGKDDDDLDYLETVADPEEKDPIKEMLGEEAQEIVQKAIERLPEREQMVLSLYFNEELNLKEIGAVLDITESRASQLRTKAIGMLRSYMKEFIEA